KEAIKNKNKLTKSSLENSQPIDFIKWFSELDKNSGSVAGGKGANLSEIYNLKVPVPPGFVVTAQAYDYFIEKAGIKNKIHELLGRIDYEDTKKLDEHTKEIREIILNSKFPKEMEEEIVDSYEHLDVGHLDNAKGSALDILKTSSEPVFVAVRSSATTEDLAEASFAGQQDSFVNIKGKNELLKHIRKCFASLFTSRATYYRNKKGFKHEEASLAVVVQKMVDSDKSGVIFSKDPSYKNDNIIIEAVWGLGEGIVSGRITPDKYILSKDLEITDTKIADKKIAITRDSGGRKEVVKLRGEKSNHQVLKNHEIRKLGEIAIQLEEHYQKPQDIEFAIEGEDIYIVQTRPITTIEKRIEQGSQQEIKGEPILKGLAASPGIASGKIKIVETLEDLQKVSQGDILVTKMTNPDMVVTMQKSAAIITDEGGLTAHAAIVSREMGIPCVVGTQEATIKLKEGELITVDGFTGKIYKGKVAENVQKEVLPVTANTKTKIKVVVDLPSFAERAAKSQIKSIGLTRIEGIIAESGKHPEYFLQQGKIDEYEKVIFKGIDDIAKYFEEIWVRTSDIRSDEFSNLEGAPKEKEANPMLGMHGIRYGIKNPEILKAELRALKKVVAKGKKVGLLLPQVISVEEVQKVKEFLKEVEFKDAKIGVMVETPAAVQLIRDLCEEGIDFISFGTNDLTQYILAVDRGNEQVQHLYNEMHPAVLHQLEFVIRVCKRNKVESSICGQAGSKKEMVKFLVEKGIDSISVNPDVAKEISDYVAELEQSVVKGTDEEPRQYELKKLQEEFVKPQITQEPEDSETIKEAPLGVSPNGTRPQTAEFGGKDESESLEGELIKDDIEELKVPEKKYLQNSVDNGVIGGVQENIEKGLEAMREIMEELGGDAPVISGIRKPQQKDAPESDEDDEDFYGEQVIKGYNDDDFSEPDNFNDYAKKGGREGYSGEENNEDEVFGIF
ncbi:MAG: phosphoenolpyruvate synthase, partial [Nanoarchaeota archaeon]